MGSDYNVWCINVCGHPCFYFYLLLLFLLLLLAMYFSHIWIGKINEKSGHWVMRIKAHPLEKTHRHTHTRSPPNKHVVRSVCSFWTHSRGSISSNNSMHFCRFFLSALKEEQPPRTNERNFQTVIYFIRQMRCVSPLAVLTRNCPLSLSLSLSLPEHLYTFAFLSRLNVQRMATLGVCMVHVLRWAVRSHPCICSTSRPIKLWNDWNWSVCQGTAVAVLVQNKMAAVQL